MSMSEVTHILLQIEEGDFSAGAQLMPLVYEELRKLATYKLTREKPGQTLQATALVHEAFIRLVDAERHQHWRSRAHFFAAAAEAMRRILVENARRKKRWKHGGELQRVEMEDQYLAIETAPNDDVLAIDEGLELLARTDAQVAELVKLRYFGGLTVEQAAELLGVPIRTAYRHWAYARAWLYRYMDRQDSPS
jgi:RNA polymerase sigma factor (TIGR02999 family)